MKEIGNKYSINGKIFECNLEEPFLSYLIESFFKINDSCSYNLDVAVNDVLVEKYKWKRKKIFNGDKIEIVSPFLEAKDAQR